MEHLNREVKSCIASGFGKTEKGLIRLGKAIGTISPVLQQFDKISGVEHHATRHTSRSLSGDLRKIVNDLNSSKVFEDIPGRTCNCFPHIKSFVLHKNDQKKLINWIEHSIK